MAGFPHPARFSLLEPFPGVAQVVIEGEVGPGSVIPMSNFFRRLVDEKRLRVVVDLSRTPYLVSAAIGCLIGTAGELADAGGNLVLAGARPNIVHVLSLLGMQGSIRLYNSVDDAILDLMQSTG